MTDANSGPLQTNHTVLPEAMETWPVDLMQHLLPRHLAILYDINLWFLVSLSVCLSPGSLANDTSIGSILQQEVGKNFPGDKDLIRRVSFVEESNPKKIRMAYLAVIGSFKVNGVAALHSQLVKSNLFPDFVKIFGPDRFTNVSKIITLRLDYT